MLRYAPVCIAKDLSHDQHRLGLMASYVVVQTDTAARPGEDDEHIIAIVVGVQRAMVHQAPRKCHVTCAHGDTGCHCAAKSLTLS